MSGLAGKVAVITGASSGIGRATALLFARKGAKLVLSGRSAENMQAVSNECEKLSEKPVSVLGDLTSHKTADTLVQKAIDSFGQVDILVNDAGILETGTIETTSLKQYDRIFDINCRSIFYLTQLCVPHLIQSKGAIVNVSSVNGLRSFVGTLAYNMSKSAVDQFTRCVALELAEHGVRVNSVNPGVTLTELQKRGGMDPQTYEKWLERTKFTHALGRPGHPDEVARTIAFLASSDSSYITGAQVPVDGGRHALCPR